MRTKITPTMEDLAREIMEIHEKLRDPAAESRPMAEILGPLETANSRTRHLCREIIEAQTQTPRQERVRKRFIEAAKGNARFHEGVEIDHDALLSRSDEGAYVEAWLWVSAADVAAVRRAEIERQKNHEVARAKEANRG